MLFRSILIFALAVVPVAMAQQIKISGQVKSASNGETLPGVSVVIKGTTTGAATDIDGRFSLEAPSTATLVFSFVGMETQEIEIQGRTTINVSLASSASMLEELVVVGYGTSRVKDLTSAITTIKADEIIKTPSSQAMQALQGKVPGMQIIAKIGRASCRERV